MHKPRDARRSPVHQDAIILGANNSERPCTMLDISSGGARLEVRSDCEVPDRFVLALARSRLVRRNCTVIWRSPLAGRAGRMIGVRFESNFTGIKQRPEHD
jgi:hypothetical protein